MIRENNELSEMRTRDSQRPRTYYVACWSEEKLMNFCEHKHDSVAQAVACIQNADGSVKAFTDNQERPLTNEEKQGMLKALLHLYERAKKSSREDKLTGGGVLTHRGFMEVLARSRRCRLPLTFVSLNFDDFKTLNDTLGHSTGDLVLKIAGWTIRKALREMDSVARLRGDEFALLLPETSGDNARVVLDKVQAALKGALKIYRWDITFSMVAVTFPSLPGTPDEMIEIMERHMHLVKQQGKNDVSYLTWTYRDNQARSA